LHKRYDVERGIPEDPAFALVRWIAQDELQRALEPEMRAAVEHRRRYWKAQRRETLRSQHERRLTRKLAAGLQLVEAQSA
jgi:hypothetical protein